MLPALMFRIVGKDQSKPAFESTGRGIDGTRRRIALFGADVSAATLNLKGLGQAALLGIGTITTAAGAASVAVREAATSIADIGDQAKRAGIDTRSFQELAYVADQNRISVDALTDGMKELSLRADEFIVTGAGPAAEAFQRIGYSARDLKEGLADPSDLLIDIVGRLQQLDKAAQIRISDELFGGTAGERFVELVQRGADAMRDTVDEANRLGLVIDDEVIKNADEVDKAFRRVERTISTSLKTAIVAAADEVKYMLDLLDRTEDRSDAVLRRQIAEKQQAQISAQRSIFGDFSGTYVDNLQREIDALQRELLLRAQSRGPTNVPTGGRSWVDRTTDTTFRPISPPNKDATRDAERKEKAYKRVIEQLNRETAALGMNSVQQRIANQLSLAGVDATSERGQEIARLVTHLEEARAAQEAYDEQLQFFGDLGADAFRGLVQGGEDFADVMRRVGLSIADAAVQAAIFGTGPLANLLGLGGSSNLLGLFGFGGGGIGGLGSSTFAGWYAEGGTIPSGKWGIAGEAGPEVVTGPARVWTADDMAAVAGRSAGGGSSQVIVSLSAGLEAEILQQAEGQAVRIVQQYDKEVAPGTAIRAVGNANRLSLGSTFRRG